MEETQGVLRAISQVFEALGKARIDDRTANAFMNGLQLATRVAIIMAKTDPDRSQREPQRLQDVSPAPDRTLVEADSPCDRRRT